MPKGVGALLAVIVTLFLIALFVYLVSRSLTYSIIAGAVFVMALYILLHKFEIV